MKRKAMEIEKSKMESARAGKAGRLGAYAPSGHVQHQHQQQQIRHRPGPHAHLLQVMLGPWHLPQRLISQHMALRSIVCLDQQLF